MCLVIQYDVTGHYTIATSSDSLIFPARGTIGLTATAVFTKLLASGIPTVPWFGVPVNPIP